MLNEKEFEFLGIKKFHDAGYTGSRVTVASKENIIHGVFNDVESITSGTTVDKYSKHGTLVMDYIRQVVPNARLLAAETMRRL